MSELLRKVIVMFCMTKTATLAMCLLKTLVYTFNMPMIYTAIFRGCKNGNFQMKNCDLFLIFAQNIDCGYMLEPPH